MSCARSWTWSAWLLAAACTVQPDGLPSARERAALAGAAYAQRFADRDLPALPADAGLEVWLAYAERANGELEAAYERWVAALEEVPQAGTQDTTAMVGVEHRLDGGAVLDRTAGMLMSDAMNNLVLPGRLEARAEAALQRAKVAAAAFDRARLQLQVEVAAAFWTLALRDEEIGRQRELVAVLRMQVPSARAQVAAGRVSQREPLAAAVALQRAEAELAGLEAGRPALVATLRAVVGVRDGGADVRPVLAELRGLDAGEQEWLDRALRGNAGLEAARAEQAAAMAEVAAREWQRVPEFSLRGLAMGDGVVTLAGALTVPFLRSPAIDAAVRQAEAEVRATAALRRQAGQDAVAAVLVELAALDAVQRETTLLRERVLPRLRQLAASARSSWSTGGADFADWADAAVTTIAVELQLARLRAAGLMARARLAAAAGGV